LTIYSLKPTAGACEMTNPLLILFLIIGAGVSAGIRDRSEKPKSR